MSNPSELTPDQLARLHLRLVASTERARENLAAARADFAAIVDASTQSNADDEHDPEGTTIAFERAQVSALIECARLAETDAVDALARWESGTYGRCEVCGAPIAYERLIARPATTRCIADAGS